MLNVPDLLLLNDGTHYTPAELAKYARVHRTTIVRLFLDEPGVLRFGHAATRKKEQRYRLRIPGSVAKRVFGRLTVPPRQN